MGGREQLHWLIQGIPPTLCRTGDSCPNSSFRAICKTEGRWHCSTTRQFPILGGASASDIGIGDPLSWLEIQMKVWLRSNFHFKFPPSARLIWWPWWCTRQLEFDDISLSKTYIPKLSSVFPTSLCRRGAICGDATSNFIPLHDS